MVLDGKFSHVTYLFLVLCNTSSVKLLLKYSCKRVLNCRCQDASVSDAGIKYFLSSFGDFVPLCFNLCVLLYDCL